MRQRRPKNLEEKMEKLQEYLISDPEAQRGKWRSDFPLTGSADRRLFLEIGSGKGRFINESALGNREDLYVGFEGRDAVMIRALEKVRNNGLDNLKLCECYIKDLDIFFDDDELDGIYLNFIDPWPKDRHKKRRLTSKRYLDGYAACLKQNGFLKIKTDNDTLFRYSVEQFELHDAFEISEITEDLHNSKYNKDNIMTEYELKFFSSEKKIKYIHAVIKK